jgi:hypothetical protein
LIAFHRDKSFLEEDIAGQEKLTTGIWKPRRIGSGIQYKLSLPHWCHFSSLTHKNVMSPKHSCGVHFLILPSPFFELCFTQVLGEGHVYYPGCLLTVSEHEKLSVGDPTTSQYVLDCIMHPNNSIAARESMRRRLAGPAQCGTNVLGKK